MKKVIFYLRMERKKSEKSKNHHKCYAIPLSCSFCLGSILLILTSAAWWFPKSGFTYESFIRVKRENTRNNDDVSQFSPGKEEYREAVLLMKKGVSNPLVNYFEAKHLNLNGQSPIDVQLTSSATLAKQYVLNLNQKVCGGDILPAYPETENVVKFADWLHHLESRSLVIIDANVSALQADVKTVFDAWKVNFGVDGEGNLVDYRGRPLGLYDMPLLTTENKYRLTLLTFNGDYIQGQLLGRGETLRGVTVKAEQITSELMVRPDYSGKPRQFEGVTFARQSLLRGARPIATFDRVELSIIARVTRELWRNTGNDHQEMLLNDEHVTFRNLKAVADADYLDQMTRRGVQGLVQTNNHSGVCFSDGGEVTARWAQQRNNLMASRSDTKCAVMLMSEGVVDAIYPSRFIGGYTGWSGEEKRGMMRFINGNENKVVADGYYTSLLANLVMLENVKSHVDTAREVENGEMMMNAEVIKLSGGSDVYAQVMLLLDRWNSLLQNLADGSSKVKMSGWRGAQQLFRITNTLAASSEIGAVKKTENPPVSLANNFLTKLIVNGIAQGDSGLVTIAATRLGYDPSLMTISEWATAKYFAKALKWGKVMGALGDTCGVIGDPSDFALSFWSLIKSVERMNNNTGTCSVRGGAAIKNLDVETSDIVARREQIKVPVVFCPENQQNISVAAALDLASLQATEIFNARTEWSRIDTSTPLPNYGNAQVFTSQEFDWFGERKRNFTFELLGEKISCTTNLCEWHILERNPNFAGIVFPPKDEHTGYSHGSRSDSVVDFGEKQKVHLERVLPKDLETAVLKCQPSTTDFMDESISQRQRKTAYLCENAVAVEQPSTRILDFVDQVFIFDLGDGDDIVLVGDDPTPNLFLMGNDGSKEFHGGGGKDDFFFYECSAALRGEFNGGAGQDRVTLGDECSRGEEMMVDFRRGRLTSRGNTVNMEFKSIEDMIGRKGQREVVEVAHTTKWLATKGGSSTQMDEIIIKNDQRLEFAAFNLTVLGTEYTKVVSTATKGVITVPIHSPWNGFQVDVVLNPQQLELHLMFMNSSSSDIVGSILRKGRRMLELTLSASQEQTSNFTFSRVPKFRSHMTIPIYFTEGCDGVPDSVLLITDKAQDPLIFYHNVPPQNSDLQRTGCQVLENVFDIHGENCRLTGGSNADQFILHTGKIGMIDGGNGTDTLMLHPSFTKALSVDLGSQRFKNIEKVFGVPGVPLTVETACDTNLVVGQGGSDVQSDFIKVKGGPCSNGELKQIVALGNTRVEVVGGMDKIKNQVVYLLADASEGRKELRFEMETKSANLGHVLVAILAAHKNWTVEQAKMDAASEQINVELRGYGKNGRKDVVKLNLKQDTNHNSTDSYFQMPYIQLSVKGSADVPGVLVFDKKSGMASMIHQLEGWDTASTANGYSGIENIFRLATSDQKWEAIGGGMSDKFFLTVTVKDGGQYGIHGGLGGQDNILFLEGPGNRHQPFLVNLVNHEIGYQSTPPVTRGSVENIQHVVGRKNAPDLIHANCDTKTIDGRSGRGEGRQGDVITIRYNRCYDNMFVAVGKYTTVKNAAVKGQFTYLVEDLVTSALELDAFRTNRHLIKLQFHPWDYITAVEFDSVAQVMRWRVSDGQQERGQTFQVSKDLDAEEYNNPVFEFSPVGSGVTSDIRVSASELTMATFQISSAENVQGLPVDINRFIISTHLGQYRPNGSIQGSSLASRPRSNQFWMMGLGSPLETLDGGECRENGCTNYLVFPPNVIIGNLHVDMDVEHGAVRSDDGSMLISQLKNIHELQGTREITSYPTCDTVLVAGVGEVVIKSGDCPLDMIIGVEQYTQVSFLKEMKPQQRVYPNSTVHYRFSHPMSFDVQGCYTSMLSHQHIYYLPFELHMLSDIRFDLEEHRLFYTLLGTEYNHSMITRPSFLEQFYSQPSMVTEDGYRIQVGRAGSIWTTFGGDTTTADVEMALTPMKMSELQNMANGLGITMVIQTATDFFFIGHSSGHSKKDRNVLQNVFNKTSHLYGGGAEDTIYEIVSLATSDVFIYTGYTQPTFNNWLVAADKREQTIDLTDVVIPIRVRAGSKYVPRVSTEGNNLVIRMEGHEDIAPGRVVIENGAYPWIAKRVQFLLNSAIMDLVPVSQWTLRSRRKRSSDLSSAASSWRLYPRPVVISRDVSVYSISPEELEDGQDIQLDASFTARELDTTFSAIRNGRDLYLTNIQSPGEMGMKSIVISDLFEPSPHLGFKNLEKSVPFYNYFNRNESHVRHLWQKKELKLPAALYRVTAHLPGLSLMLSDSQMTNLTTLVTTPKNAVGYQLPVSEWKRTLSTLEGRLLERMPTIPRVFPFQQDLWRVPYTTTPRSGPICNKVHSIWYTRAHTH